MNRLTYLYALTIMFLAACTPAPAPEAGLSPAESHASLRLMEGFEIELVAAEPLVADPVAMEIDEHGRAYVVQMPGYPLDLSQTGKVVRLLDTDHDGNWDQSEVFADDLTLPTGIMRWKNGFLVTDAPHVWFLADTDDDGKADVREIVLTGFALSNPQHNFNTPIYGLDNWIYLANEYTITSVGFEESLGDKGTEIFFPQHPEGSRLPQNGGDRNVRFRPDQLQLEMCAGRSQYGHTFDKWGHHFTTNNAAHLWHEVIAAPYLLSKPELATVDAMNYVPQYGRPAEVFPQIDKPVHQLLTDVGTITSACGITWYQGGAFPPPFDQVVFTGEPTHNLVHADIVKPEGASFAAKRLVENSEFLSSSDPWFRPVSFYTGPSGEVYVIDYYRKIIEHPEWMSEEVNESGELYNGTQKGRIYRITAKGQTLTESPDLSAISPQQLISLLGHANIWYRRHAQRMLVDLAEASLVPLLEEKATKDSNEIGRLHALWVLDGMDTLTHAVIIKALQDPVAGIRENAIRLAEKHLESSPELVQRLLAMETDQHHRVRFQLIATLGQLEGQAYEAPIFRLLHAQHADEWSILAALTGNEGESIARSYLLKKANDPDIPLQAMERLAARLGQIDGLQGDLAALSSWLRTAKSEPPFIRHALSELARGLHTRGTADLDISESIQLAALRLAQSSKTDIAHAVMDVLEEIGMPEHIPQKDELMQQLRQGGSPPEARTAKLRLLSLVDRKSNQAYFEEQLQPSVPTPVQRAAIRALDGIEGPAICDVLLTRWDQFTPELRNEAVGVMMHTPERMSCLLGAVEQKQVDPSAIGWRRTVHLMNHDHLPTRNRARALLAQPQTAEAEILQKFRNAPEMTGSALAGKSVFEKLCSTCHQVQGETGNSFGPDLASVRHRDPQSLMIDILLPQRSIADGYELWIATTDAGETVSGIIVADAGDQLTLRDAAGVERQLLRSRINSLEAAPNSAMTAGLGEQMSPQQMTDLLAYLRKWPELRAAR